MRHKTATVVVYRVEGLDAPQCKFFEAGHDYDGSEDRVLMTLNVNDVEHGELIEHMMKIVSPNRFEPQLWNALEAIIAQAYATAEANVRKELTG